MTAEHRWVLPLPYDRPPLSLNDRGHWSKGNADRQGLRRAGAFLARSKRVPRGLDHIHTRLHYVPPDNRRRDEDNLISTAKPCWDGLIDAGIVKDDNSRYMTKYMPKIHPGSKHHDGPRLWLEIWIEEHTTP